MSLLRSRAQGGGTECQFCSQSVCSSVGLPLSWGTGGVERAQLGPARVCGPFHSQGAPHPLLTSQRIPRAEVQNLGCREDEVLCGVL